MQGHSCVARWRRAITVAGLALSSCGGGGSGSGDPPSVTMSFATSAATVAEGAGALSVVVVLHTILPALGRAMDQRTPEPHSGRWQTASTLLPSGSRTKAP